MHSALVTRGHPGVSLRQENREATVQTKTMQTKSMQTERSSLSHLPVKVVIGELVASRYAPGGRSGGNERPSSWDERRAGIDVVRTTDGKTLRLASDGGQSPPQTGWILIVQSGDANAGYQWTLYGISASPGSARSEKGAFH